MGAADIALGRSSRTSVAQPYLPLPMGHVTDRETWFVSFKSIGQWNPLPSSLHHQAWVVMARASLSLHVFHQEAWEGEATPTQRGHLSRGSANSLMDTQEGIFWGPPSLVLGHRHQHSGTVPCPTPGGGIH